MKTLFLVSSIFVSVTMVYSLPERGRQFVSSELSLIPEEIIQCYMDRKLWDRFNRLPYSIDSLIAIIRKVELHPQIINWTPGRLAANLIHRFRFDGIQYDRCIDTSAGALPITVHLMSEYSKMQLIWQLVDGDRNEFPSDVLTPIEKCSLHWMLSYAVNTTFREEELYDLYSSGQITADFQEFKEQSPIFSCDENRPSSFAPVESGVVLTDSGPVSTSTLITGIAAGLKPKIVHWPTTETNKRRLSSEWGATLAGDLAQTSLLKKKSQSYVGPDGWFNTSLCPREFSLQIRRDSTFSHFTVSEINGGIDGLVLAMHQKTLESGTERRLSQILDEYYNSLTGLHVQESSVILMACLRYVNYKNFVDGNKLLEEAVTFGLEYKSVLAIPINEVVLRKSLQLSRDELNREIEVLKGTTFDICRKKASIASNVIETPVTQAGIADVGLILDTSSYSLDDWLYQNQVAASLALKLDTWTTEVSNDRGHESLVSAGSTLEVSEGRFGKNIFGAGNSSISSWNKAEFACQLMKRSQEPSGVVVASESILAVASRMADRREESLRNGGNFGRSQVILLFHFGRIATPDQQPLRNSLWKLRDSKSDVKLIIVTRWAPANEFYNYVEDPSRDIIALSQFSGESNAVVDAEKISARVSNISGQILFPECRDPGYKEWDSFEMLYLLPQTERFVTLHSRFFYTSTDLKISFHVNFNGAKICWSRRDLTIDRSGESCSETSGDRGKITFDFQNPCNGEESDWCTPIYFRLTGIDAGRSNCLIDGKYPCRSPSAAEIRITHQGMTCSASTFSAHLWIPIFVIATLWNLSPV